MGRVAKCWKLISSNLPIIAYSFSLSPDIRQYAVMWQNGRPLQVGDDAPDQDGQGAADDPSG